MAETTLIIKPLELLQETLVEARQNFNWLLQELIPFNENEPYTSLIGDDIAGRFPTLILGRILKKRAADRHGIIPSIHFFSGVSDNGILSNVQNESFAKYNSREVSQMYSMAREIRLDRLSSHFGRIQSYVGSRALILTERMTMGKAISEASSALIRNGVRFDIAALSSANTASHYKTIFKEVMPEFNSYLMLGDQKDIGQKYFSPLGWGDNLVRPLIGVKKDGYLDPHSAPMQQKDIDRQGMKDARRLLRDYADELYMEHFNS